MAQRGGKRPGAGRKRGKVSQAKRTLAEMAKDHADAALKTLAAVHADEDAPAAARVSAATAILDRAYGKPQQSVALSNPDGTAIQPTTIILSDASGMMDDDEGEGAEALN